MKYLLAFVILVLIGGGLYWYASSQTSQNTADTEVGIDQTENFSETNDDENTAGNDDEEFVGTHWTFDIVGTDFAFDQTEISVSEGDKVTINFTSGGGFHDWVLDEFNAATDRVQDGETASVTFVADRAGEFEYYCSVGSHRAQGMVGKLTVLPQTDNPADTGTETVTDSEPEL